RQMDLHPPFPVLQRLNPCFLCPTLGRLGHRDHLVRLILVLCSHSNDWIHQALVHDSHQIHLPDLIPALTSRHFCSLHQILGQMDLHPPFPVLQRLNPCFLCPTLGRLGHRDHLVRLILVLCSHSNDWIHQALVHDSHQIHLPDLIPALTSRHFCSLHQILV